LQLTKSITDKHEEVMARMGSIMAAGILDVGGRNATLALRSGSGYFRRTSVVGLAVFTGYWYWYPLRWVGGRVLFCCFGVSQHQRGGFSCVCGLLVVVPARNRLPWLAAARGLLLLLLYRLDVLWFCVHLLLLLLLLLPLSPAATS
jgi:hypothetical protein